MENVRRHATNLLNLQQQKLIKLARTKRRRNYLVSEPNYHATKFFTKKLLAIEMRKTQILMNKPVYQY